jgi:adenylylsulfate kinase
MSGVVVWFTGLPASGKSTLARRVRELLASRRACLVLDSDAVRDVLGQHAYSEDRRDELYGVLARLAALCAEQGLVVLVAATAPRRAHREHARAIAPCFLEVHVGTALDECERRDPKGLYAQARVTAASTLPGIGVPYEAPERPDVVAAGGLDEAAASATVERIESMMPR